MYKILLSIIIVVTGFITYAQSPTIITNATNCFVYHNFNTTNEGFSSPSIYSDANDVSFNWDVTAGLEVETSGLTVRSASLISPVYMQVAEGNTTLGFRYVAPIGAEYRIRIISAVIGTPLEVLATTANGPVWTPLPELAGNICLLLTDADLTSGRQLRYEFTFRLNHAGNVYFDDLSQAVANSPLPVIFEGFVARKNTDGSLKLLWNVGEEHNVKGYYVESSKDGINFTIEGFVDASAKSIYSFEYPQIMFQTMYFRVRNLDFDNKSKYTPVIKVYAKEQFNTRLLIYPMPATDLVTIQHNGSASNSIIILSDLEGKVLQEVHAAPHTFQTQLNIQKLAKGIYFVRYSDGKTEFLSGKLIKN